MEFHFGNYGIPKPKLLSSPTVSTNYCRSLRINCIKKSKAIERCVQDRINATRIAARRCVLAIYAQTVPAINVLTVSSHWRILFALKGNSVIQYQPRICSAQHTVRKWSSINCILFTFVVSAPLRDASQYKLKPGLHYEQVEAPPVSVNLRSSERADRVNECLFSHEAGSDRTTVAVLHDSDNENQSHLRRASSWMNSIPCARRTMHRDSWTRLTCWRTENSGNDNWLFIETYFNLQSRDRKRRNSSQTNI